MDFEDKLWNCIKVLLIVAAMAVLSSFWVLPKSHNGYYMDCSTMGNFPSYRIYNNWKYFPDSVAFTTQDKDECLRVFKELQRVSK